MIWQQLSALVWIRWRIAANKMKKAGLPGAVLGTVLGVVAILSIGINFLISLVAGIVLLPQASSLAVFATWTIMTGVFCVFWLIGLMADLQRSEVLSLRQLLHLPVSGRHVFLLNYVSSFACLTMLTFVPVFAGISSAHLLVDGIVMFWIFPLIASFLLLVTSTTYQLRGWLAVIMEDKRRARKITGATVIAFIALSQIPNALNIYFNQRHEDQRIRVADQQVQLIRDMESGKITEEEFVQLTQERSRTAEEVAEARSKSNTNALHTASSVFKCIPPAWLSYGVYRLHSGKWLPAVWGTIGAMAISGVSLWCGYRTTLRQCQGTSPRRNSKSAKSKTTTNRSGQRNWLELNVPFVSHQVSSVAMMSLRNVLRAPEARMMFITPLILFGLMMGTIFAKATETPAFAHPAFTLLLLWIAMVSVAQLLQNQFGLDRNGFRALVLSPIARQDILLGKNIAAVPIVFGFGMIAIVLSACLFPLTLDESSATVIQMVSLFVTQCCVSNYASILAPTQVAVGAARKSKPTLVVGLLQMLFMMLLPIAMLPQIAACGLSVLARYADRWPYVPIYSILATLALGCSVFAYAKLLPHQGKILENYELKVLQAVTSKDE